MKGETTMEKFKEILKGKITERVTDGEVVFNSMMKNNGLELEAVTIKRTNENITPVLYLESYFEEHKGNLLSLRDRTGSASRFPMLAK